MTTLYKRAGSGNWSAAGSWSLTSGGGATGTVPTAADDVILDANSGTLTVDGTSGAPSLCRSINCTGFTGTLGRAATSSQLNVGDGTTGHFTLVSGMTFTAPVIKFVSTTTGNQITTAGKSFLGVEFDGVGGVWTLQDSLTLATGNVLTLTNGHLDTNGQAVSAGFSSNNSNVRALTMGATNWTLPNNAASNWNIANSTNMTLSAASATITAANTTANISFDGGGLSYGTFINNAAMSSGSVTINQSNTFGTLTMNNGASAVGTLILGANQTVTGTFTRNGNSVINRAFTRSSAVGTPRTITAGTVSSQHSDWQDIVGAGAASWNLSAITGLSGDCGGNSGITFTTPTILYWVPSGGTSAGSMSATTRWATTTGGAGGARSPLPQDTAIFDANSIDAGSRTISQDKARLGKVDWTGVTNNPTWQKNTATTFYNDIIMVAGMTNNSTATYTYSGQGDAVFTSAGQTFTNSLVVDCGGGSLTFSDAYNGNATGNTILCNSGTLNTGSSLCTLTAQLNVAAGTCVVGSGGVTCSNITKSGTGGTLTINGASTSTGTITLSSSGGTVNVNANVTGEAGLSVSSATALNITNATLTTTSVVIAGAGSGGFVGSGLLRGAL